MSTSCPPLVQCMCTTNYLNEQPFVLTSKAGYHQKGNASKHPGLPRKQKIISKNCTLEVMLLTVPFHLGYQDQALGRNKADNTDIFTQLAISTAQKMADERSATLWFSFFSIFSLSTPFVHSAGNMRGSVQWACKKLSSCWHHMGQAMQAPPPPPAIFPLLWDFCMMLKVNLCQSQRPNFSSKFSTTLLLQPFESRCFGIYACVSGDIKLDFLNRCRAVEGGCLHGLIHMALHFAWALPNEYPRAD